MAQKPAFQSILFPVDFSEMSKMTAPHVRGLAQLTGATVTLLHVIPWLSAWYGGATEIRAAVPGDEGLRGLEADQAARLEKFRQEHFGGVVCRTSIVSGAVAESITDTAKDAEADLIMMPTRGIGPSRRFLIGSTTAKVLHDASCAVWTTPHLYELHPFAGFHHLLCTIDRGEVLPDFLREAVRLASCFGSKLSFVTAVSSTVGGTGEARRIGTLDKEYPQADLHDELGRGLDCTVYLETGPVGAVVKHLVEEHKIDLVVTNRGHLQHPFGKLRTHAYEIVLESPCPVLNLSIAAKQPPHLREHVAVQTA
ncbi:MAG: universal stress protein [Acidobacteriaceae bacterium]|nr:universal stress protein [Acidobacteriaceae bacterium]